MVKQAFNVGKKLTGMDLVKAFNVIYVETENGDYQM